MAGQSAFGTVMKAGAASMRNSKMPMRTGPSNKNLGPSASRQANPTGMLRGMSPIKGPDKGAGGR